MADLCELKTGGMVYGGWKDIQIQRGLEQVSGQFSLQVSDRWPDLTAPRPIKPGDSCVITIDGEAVLTGWVDDANPGFDDKTVSFSIAGRDKTGDLVECSAIYKSGQWKNASLLKIATDLLAGYSIAIVVGDLAKSAATEVIASFNVEEGETVFDCIERAARLKAVMLWTDGSGRLVIDRPGSTRAEVALVEGENILRADGKFSWAERHSEYIVKGQARGHAQHAARGRSVDATVTRYRPLVIIAEDQAHGPTAQERADWEKTVRKGRANRATVRVRGWRQHGDGTGPLWVPGLRVHLKSPRLRVDAEMLVVAVTYIKNSNDGTVADIEIADPRAFDLLAGIRTAGLKATRNGDKGLANNGDKHGGNKKRKKKSEDDDWSDL